MGYEEVKKAFAQTLEKLGTDYLDMYLIHWPLPNPKYKDWKELDVETWRGLEELYKAGKVKAIGVSNFLLHHLENLNSIRDLHRKRQFVIARKKESMCRPGHRLEENEFWNIHY